MIFEKTSIQDCYNILIEKHEDQRGFFGRVFDKKEFESKGLRTQFVQSSISKSLKKGTVRGFHYQVAPNLECKLVRCIKGKAYTVIVDLRKSSPTFGKSDGFEITSDNYAVRYVPEGCANCTQMLEDNTDLFYLTTGYYSLKYERGIKWNDPFFKIKLPLKVTNISDKDKNWKPFNPDTCMT